MRVSRYIVTGFLAIVFFSAQAQESTDQYDFDCGPLKIAGRHGPFDYNKASQYERHMVEKAHFNENYEAYRKGKKKFQKDYDHVIETPAGGFTYTLWAFPNHHKALAAMEDISYKARSDSPSGAGLRIHCYFQRAVKFTPRDSLVRALYGYYYARRGKAAEAIAQPERMESLDKAVMSSYVYASFAYLEIKEYDKALEAAKLAYQLGYPFPGLRNRLKRAGKWKD